LVVLRRFWRPRTSHNRNSSSCSSSSRRRRGGGDSLGQNVGNHRSPFRHGRSLWLGTPRFLTKFVCQNVARQLLDLGFVVAFVHTWLMLNRRLCCNGCNGMCLTVSFSFGWMLSHHDDSTSHFFGWQKNSLSKFWETTWSRGAPSRLCEYWSM